LSLSLSLCWGVALTVPSEGTTVKWETNYLRSTGLISDNNRVILITYPGSSISSSRGVWFKPRPRDPVSWSFRKFSSVPLQIAVLCFLPFKSLPNHH
jgi:hypothetical protein